MHRWPGGFTLLEVAVATGIASMLIAALLWQVRPLQDRIALRAAAVELVSELRAAQARAVAERKPDRAHGIEFPAEGGFYVPFVRAEGGRVPLRQHDLPARVRITYARFGGIPNLVMFSGVSLLGAPSGGGTVTLRAGSAVLCVRVLPATGRIRIADTGCP